MEAAVSDIREEALSALLHETRPFAPPEELAKEANAQPGIYAEAEADPLAFWASQAKRLTWDTPWTEVLEWNLPFAKWFVGGTAQRGGQLRRPPRRRRPGGPGRLPLGGRARRHPDDHLRRPARPW